MQVPRELLNALGLSEAEIDVYLAMREGGARVADILRITGRKRPTVYYALDSLEKRGLVSKSGSSTLPYRVEPAHRLVTIARKHKDSADETLADAAAFAAELSAHEESRGDVRPSVSFYEGKDAVRSVIMETLYCRSKHIDCIAPHDNFFKQSGGMEFVRAYITERAKRRVHTRNLWEETVKTETIRRFYAEHSEVRILPNVMKRSFATTIFIYDDKVLYVSSLKNAYCILIASRELHDTMRALFEGLWGASKPHKK